jgi:hypothetical protein
MQVTYCNGRNIRETTLPRELEGISEVLVPIPYPHELFWPDCSRDSAITAGYSFHDFSW